MAHGMEIQSLMGVDALGSHFSIESHVLSTRSADAYTAIAQGTGTPVCLWMLRHPLTPKSEAEQRFQSRMQKIAEMQPPLCQILGYGVDGSGMAYAAIPSLNGQPIATGNVELSEAERRFMSCLKMIDRIHSAGVVCGDLCGSSFWIDRGGDLKFIGVLGSFDSEAASTAMLPPMETLHYVSPEQRSGGGLEPASDIYSLGVLGYFLLTGKYPYDSSQGPLANNFELSSVQKLSSLMPNAPVWADEVLLQCLNPKPEQRYPNAQAVLKAIADVRQRVVSGLDAPVKVVRDAVIVKKPQAQKIAVQTIKTKMPSAAPQERPPEKNNLKAPKLSVTSVVILVLIGAVLLGNYIASGRAVRSNRVNQDMAIYGDGAGNPEVKKVIPVLRDSQISSQERQKQLEQLANSDDPLAQRVLVRSALEARTESDRLIAEKAIIDRARRLGLIRSSEQIRQWLRTLKSEDLPSCYEAVLNSLDTTLPIDARNSTIRQVYTSNQKLAMKLASALALDSTKADDYQPLLSQLMTDYLKLEDAQKHSVLGLVFSNSELALLFGDDVIQRREQLGNDDILWLLKILADRNDSNVRPIANLAIERNLLTPLRASFLSLVRDRGDIPSDVLTSLIKASAGAIKIEDIATLAKWYDMSSEKMLLAICADSVSREMLLEAFDTLAGKNVTVEPAASLINWVRDHAWDKRADYARVIGIVANIDLLGVDAISEAFDSLDNLAKNPTFLEILLSSNDPDITKLVVDKYSDNLGMGGLINLLKHKDKGVRINSIKKLKDVNEIAVLRMIIDRYESEKDPDVKQAYRDNFWVIKQRDAKK